MDSQYSVSLDRIIQSFNLEILRAGTGYEERAIRTEDINRPGLQLIGFFDYFDPTRIQVIGKVETTYLSGLTAEERQGCFDSLFAQDIPALVITREMDPFPECMELAEKYDRTILRTKDTTSSFMSGLIAFLRSGRMPVVGGEPIPLAAHSVCVHGDNAESVLMAREIRARLQAEAVSVASFLAP